MSTKNKTNKHVHLNTPAVTNYRTQPDKTHQQCRRRIWDSGKDWTNKPQMGTCSCHQWHPGWNLGENSKQTGCYRPSCWQLPTWNLGTEPRDWGFQPNGRLWSKLPAAPNMELVISHKWETGWKTN